MEEQRSFSLLRVVVNYHLVIDVQLRCSVDPQSELEIAVLVRNEVSLDVSVPEGAFELRVGVIHEEELGFGEHYLVTELAVLDGGWVVVGSEGYACLSFVGFEDRTKEREFFVSVAAGGI
jgi:hypothetical protein